MALCLVPHCRNGTWCKDTSVTFHALPKDMELRQAWLKAIKIQPGVWPKQMVNRRPVVCSAHFTSDCYRKVMGFRCLKTSAVPTIFPTTESSEMAESVANDKEVKCLESSVKGTPSVSQSTSQDLGIAQYPDKVEIVKVKSFCTSVVPSVADGMALLKKSQPKPAEESTPVKLPCIKATPISSLLGRQSILKRKCVSVESAAGSGVLPAKLMKRQIIVSKKGILTQQKFLLIRRNTVEILVSVSFLDWVKKETPAEALVVAQRTTQINIKDIARCTLTLNASSQTDETALSLEVGTQTLPLQEDKDMLAQITHLEEKVAGLEAQVLLLEAEMKRKNKKIMTLTRQNNAMCVRLTSDTMNTLEGAFTNVLQQFLEDSKSNVESVISKSKQISLNTHITFAKSPNQSKNSK